MQVPPGINLKLYSIAKNYYAKRIIINLMKSLGVKNITFNPIHILEQT